jgi:hypothetical protein
MRTGPANAFLSLYKNALEKTVMRRKIMMKNRIILPLAGSPCNDPMHVQRNFFYQIIFSRAHKCQETRCPQAFREVLQSG